MRDIIIVLLVCQWLWKAWTDTDQHWPLNGWSREAGHICKHTESVSWSWSATHQQVHDAALQSLSHNVHFFTHSHVYVHDNTDQIPPRTDQSVTIVIITSVVMVRFQRPWFCSSTIQPRSKTESFCAFAIRRSWQCEYLTEHDTESTFLCRLWLLKAVVLNFEFKFSFQ